MIQWLPETAGWIGSDDSVATEEAVGWIGTGNSVVTIEAAGWIGSNEPVVAKKGSWLHWFW